MTICETGSLISIKESELNYIPCFKLQTSSVTTFTFGWGKSATIDFLEKLLSIFFRFKRFINSQVINITLSLQYTET